MPSMLSRLYDKPSEGETAQIVDGLFDIEKNVGRRILERVWWRNVLYYVGEQWIEWLKSTSSFRRRLFYTQPSTPVSNEIREYIRALKAMLINQKMVPRVVPNSEERADIDAAKVAQQLLIHMDSLNDGEIEDEKEKLVISIGLWGNGFLRTFPFKEGGQWFIHKDGSVVTTGDVVTENIIPFNVITDENGDSLRKKKWVGIQSLRNREWVEDTFKIKVSNTDTAAATVDYQRKLMSLVGQVSPWKGTGLDYTTNDTPDEDLVAFREMEFKPDMKRPEGRYLVVCGGKRIMDVNRMVIPAEKDYWTYTLTHFPFNRVPGRFWADSGVDDLISPQNSINEIDKSLAENRRTVGRPTVVTPGEVRLNRISEKEDHVLVLSYDGLTSGGGRPIIQQGIPMPPQIFEERMMHKTTIQEKGGDPKNVLKGQAPSAHASGVMTDILRETAERGYYPDIDRYNRGMSSTYRSRLLVVKMVYTDERIVKVIGKGNKVKVFQFKASDLRGNTDVRMEIDSGLATTKAGERATLMDLTKMGVFQQEMMVDPTFKHQLISRFGFSSLSDQSNGDMERAERENSSMAAGILDGIFTVTLPVGPDSETVMDDPMFKYDNHAIHYEIHRRCILDPEFAEWPVEAQAALIVHTDVHNMMVQAAKAQAMQEAMLAQGGMGGGAGTGGANPKGSQPDPGLETTSGQTPPEGGMM